jgi:hypothetical protein
MQKMTRLSTIACKHTCQRKAGESSSSYALTSWVALPLVTAAARNCNRNFTSGDRDGDDLASGPVISIIASGGPGRYHKNMHFDETRVLYFQLHNGVTFLIGGASKLSFVLTYVLTRFQDAEHPILKGPTNL